MVQGQRKDHNTIFLKLRIADSTGSCFLFIKSIVYLELRKENVMA